MQITKKQKNAIIFGLICIALAPIISISLNRLSLWNQQGITILEDSDVSFQKAYNFTFSLGLGQTLRVKFSCYYVNSTVILKMIGRGKFDEEFARNTTHPHDTTGRYFVYARPAWESSSASFVTSAQADRDDFYDIEYKGDGDVNRIWSEPGDYVIMVYGTNAGAGPLDVEVKFNLEVTINGPGELIATILYIVGGALVGLAALSVLLEVRKKLLGVN